MGRVFLYKKCIYGKWAILVVSKEELVCEMNNSLRVPPNCANDNE